MTPLLFQTIAPLEVLDTLQAFAMMEAVAGSMEEPFSHSSSPPMRLLQFAFNERLLALSNSPRPASLVEDVLVVDSTGNITVRTSGVA